MEINSRVVRDIGFMDIKGDIIAFVGDELYAAAKELISNGCKRICLNLSQVPFINSSGIASLIVLNTKTNESGMTELWAYGLTPHFKKIFGMVGLTSYIKLYDGEEEILNMES
ncbi:MAG: STAS domain-containing protein [Nitrospirae bacterium]|nr:STAS domain-containing protein [Nitrospirota bacterium]